MALDRFDLWLLIAERDEPMTIEEIAKAMKVEEQEVGEILQQERHCFRLEANGRWGLEVWHLPTDFPFLTKAELILWHANSPVPERLFLHLLERVHPKHNIEGLKRVLHRRSEIFAFDGTCWRLGEIARHLENYVRGALEQRKEKIESLLEQTKQPLSLDELMVQSGLSEVFERYAHERLLTEAQRMMLKQLFGSLLHQIGIDGLIVLPSGKWITISKRRWEEVLDTLLDKGADFAGFTVQEILSSVLQIQGEPDDEAVLIEHIQNRLKECEQVECIKERWFAKLPNFVSRYTFYDPSTFKVVVEKGEVVERGSPKEQWLKKEGFYELARLGW